MKKIVQFGHWAEKNWLALVIMLSVIMMIFLCLILCSWLYGYWSNALNGTKFELMSQLGARDDALIEGGKERCKKPHVKL